MGYISIYAAGYGRCERSVTEGTYEGVQKVCGTSFICEIYELVEDMSGDDDGHNLYY